MKEAVLKGDFAKFAHYTETALRIPANDYGVDEIFEREMPGLDKSADVVIATSLNGNSRNVIGVGHVMCQIIEGAFFR
jgi:phosphoheptose isomerase